MAEEEKPVSVDKLTALVIVVILVIIYLFIFFRPSTPIP